MCCKMSDAAFPRIIALVGQKQSGKDTLADYLVREHGYENVKFADPMKDALCCLFGWSRRQVEDPVAKEVVDEDWGVSPRRMMQVFGTEIVQYELPKHIPDIQRDFFVRSLMRRISDKSRIVISDMRFMHEFAALKSHDPTCMVLRLVRPNVTRVDMLDTHASEVECEGIPVDATIINNESTSHLYREMEDLLHADDPK